ncbi:MAG: hypothetical protein B5M48_00210 [Candidatus Omnitrophica bacterium 4484_213]|nr:MAG: hypothetical protein B5M48_00210 [Candidatus Omnitrophica bacterium 4484_213]
MRNAKLAISNEKLKIAIIGAGKVGATLAMRVVEDNLGEVFLLDINKDLAQGKVLDLRDSLATLNCGGKINYCKDYSEIEDSDIVVLTAGFSRQAGMSREDLLIKNKEIIQSIIPRIKKYNPKAIIIVVTNPLDVLTYFVYKLSKISRQRIMGMSGVLDAGRFSALIAEELGVSRQNIQAMVLGMHGDLMLPLVRYSTICGVPLRQLLSQKKIEELTKKVRSRGSEIVSYLASSAYYAPSAAIFLMLKAIINDEKRVLAASAYLDGEYNLKDVCLGVPVKLGRDGVEEIIELKLNKEEKRLLQKSAEKVRDGIRKLNI